MCYACVYKLWIPEQLPAEVWGVQTDALLWGHLPGGGLGETPGRMQQDSGEEEGGVQTGDEEEEGKIRKYKNICKR